MATAGHHHDDAGRARSTARTLSQTAALAIGATLIAVGVLGFIFAGTSFNTGDQIQGEEFIVFEVNGWHNIVHIATGAFLIMVAAKPETAHTGLIAFGVIYALVTVWGFVDGDTVFQLIPVNTADNFLHLGLTAAALLVGLTAGGVDAAGRKKQEHRATGTAGTDRV